MSIEKYEFDEDFILIEDIDDSNLNFVNLLFEYPQSICIQERTSKRTSLLLIRIPENLLK